VRWLHDRAQAIHGQNGSIVRLDGITSDITERKRAEEALRESEERFRAAFEQAAVGVAHTDSDGYWLRVNRKFCDIVGYDEAELIGRTWQEMTHPDDLAADYARALQLLAGEIPTYSMEKRFIRKDALPVWVNMTTSLVRDSSGKSKYAIVVMEDITARKQAEEQLAEERNLLRTLIDNLPHYIYVKDTEGRFVLDNIADAHSMGVSSPEEMVGKTNFDLSPPDLAEQYHQDDMAVMQTGRPLLYHEEMATNERGERISILTSKFPLRDSRGQIVGLIGISMDMTERKRAEQQAIELGTQRARTKMLADFVRDASHDFRTPLSTINTSLYLLRRVTDREQQLQRINVIEQQAAQVARLVEGLLTMTRLDSEAIFNFQPQDLNRLARDVYMRMSPQAADKQLELVLDLANDLSLVPVDAVELGTALMNLVENAVQYTAPGGSVTLRTRAGRDCVLIEVSDTGIGIGDEDLPHIFERFYRADKARSAETGGVGLGLPIALKIVEAHKGRIEVETAPGDGSTFRLVLPVG
jgi:PAS domain S-box-containing protein